MGEWEINELDDSAYELIMKGKTDSRMVRVAVNLALRKQHKRFNPLRSPDIIKFSDYVQNGKMQRFSVIFTKLLGKQLQEIRNDLSKNRVKLMTCNINDLIFHKNSDSWLIEARLGGIMHQDE